MLLLTNEIRFDSFQLSEESLIHDSVLKWIPLDPYGLFRNHYELKIGEVNL